MLFTEGELVMTARRILRPAETAEKLSVSRATLWRISQRPDFPAKYRIGPNSVGWLEPEIESWLERQRVDVANG
jgi:prophage regulatory protein